MIFKWNGKKEFTCPKCGRVCHQLAVDLVYYASCPHCKKRFIVDYAKNVYYERRS